MTAVLQNLLQQTGLGERWQLSPLSGGCIGSSFSAVNEHHQRFFIKHLHNPPSNFFTAEAAGLKALSGAGIIQTPTVCAVGPCLLVLELIETCQPTEQHWQQLGHQLAELHRQPMPSFGFSHHTYCGLSEQTNRQDQNGFRFFAEQRLLPQGKRAYQAGLLDRGMLKRLERICQRLEDWIPPQSAVLIHGDLWSGNVLFGKRARHSDERSQPFLIDPAAYYGWAEADLAMTRLFGGFYPTFYSAYLETNPLQSGWQERQPLYNLYHLLNHLNLFGLSYQASVAEVLQRYQD
ncbi:hypothetical protein DV711_02780 [Motiliproteus coralliicola]|uniref:Fructosamine kinase family protein n=1 Tax=Motiliproteus coralliicola TaxID=2283196 RepID=A0A369WTZ8_9GAMM|nr:fructosamine kinase family protein [Motiliproteus coralliicola]RDE24529.1 hypothetical protein DV711_02780 [Motiliproteus coralliicola]